MDQMLNYRYFGSALFTFIYFTVAQHVFHHKVESAYTMGAKRPPRSADSARFLDGTGDPLDMAFIAFLLGKWM